ncbi:MAG: hypothetical protein IKF36_02625 [Bacilli bacterium]|nr:hypothetical protein [Bacilli bacterium]
MIKKQVVDKTRILFDLFKDFEQYSDKRLIENVCAENMNKVIDSYYEDPDNDLRIDIYVFNKLKHIILCNMVEKVRNEEDLNTEIYLINYFNYVHHLYIRKHGEQINSKYYELAIEKAIEEYDGVSTLSSYVYKKIAEVYEQNNKNIKVLLK